MTAQIFVHKKVRKFRMLPHLEQRVRLARFLKQAVFLNAERMADCPPCPLEPVMG
jgi:hypothetical protein